MSVDKKPTAEHFPSEVILKGKKMLYDKFYRTGYKVVLGLNDAKEFLKDVPDQSVMLVVTSPPYNVGKPYEERLEFRDYLRLQKEVIIECVRTLDPRGSICWEIGNYIEDKEVFPLDVFFYKMMTDIGLKLRNRIVWRVGHGLHANLRFSGRYETILWFTKSEDYVFNLDAVRVPQKYPGKRAYKGKDIGKPTGNPLGKNPSNIWDIVLRDWDLEVWDIPNVKASHCERTIHPCQYPIELVERLVLALTNENDTVLDPFDGVGSSVIAAILHNRNGIGVEKEKIYSDIAFQRIINAINGTLSRRPLGRPICEYPETKVAKIPAEWTNKNLESF
jgi:DNA modification methylase